MSETDQITEAQWEKQKEVVRTLYLHFANAPYLRSMTDAMQDHHRKIMDEYLKRGFPQFTMYEFAIMMHEIRSGSMTPGDSFMPAMMGMLIRRLEKWEELGKWFLGREAGQHETETADTMKEEIERMLKHG